MSPPRDAQIRRSRPPIGLSGVGLATAIVLAALVLAATVIWAPVGTGPGAPAAPPAPASAAPGTAAGVTALTEPEPDDRETLAGRLTPAPPARAVPPSRLDGLGAAFLADPRVAGRAVSVSVWVEGHGEVLALGADTALMPASVQKLATAAAVMERLPADFAFRTAAVATTPPDADGTVAGDLVLMAGGDPALTRSGPHSLDALAGAVAGAGIRRVEGRVLLDDSRWSAERASPGWLAWQQPRFIGWLSPLLADGNRWQRGPDAEQPGLANAQWFAGALASRGVVLANPVPRATTCGPCSARPPIAELRSTARDALVQAMLRTSDNLLAEAFLRELGFRAAGLGSSETGTVVVNEVVRALTRQPSAGADADGSGLSRLNARPAREWRALLVAASGRPWWPVVRDGLPVAGISGTLAGRFGGSAAAGNVQAKTGTTIPSRALAGVFTTASGLRATFAVIVNGSETDPPIGAEGAIDELVASLVTAT